MTKIRELTSIPDKTQLEEIEVEIVSMQNKTQAGDKFGSAYNGEAKDETGKTYVTFGSIKKFDPMQWVGKRVNLKTYTNQDGQHKSIRVERRGNYANLYITDSVKATVLGAGSAPTSQPAYQSPSPQVSQPKPAIPANLHARRLAEEWVAIHGWTKDVFEPVLGAGNFRECVTGIVIDMRRAGFEILPPPVAPTVPWKEVVYKEKPLGEWEPDKIRKVLVKLYQGGKVADNIREAFMNAAKETGFKPQDCLGQMLNDAEIDVDVADTVLLRDFQTMDDMTDEHTIQLIGNPAFLEACKQQQVAGHSPVDDIVIE